MENNKNNLKFVNIKGFRLMNELSQKEVAEYLEVSIAFISAVERGTAKLPADKFVRLLENDRDWETSALVDSPGRESRVHHDHRTIGQNIEGEFNAPVHNTSYSGYSEEQLQAELRHQTALIEQELASVKEENERLRQELAHERALNGRLLGIIEKGEFRMAEKPEGGD